MTGKPYTELPPEEKNIRDQELAAKFETKSAKPVDTEIHEVLPQFRDLGGDPLNPEENREAFERYRAFLERKKTQIAARIELLSRRGGDTSQYVIPSESFSGDLSDKLNDLYEKLGEALEANKVEVYKNIATSDEIQKLVEEYKIASKPIDGPEVDVLKISGENRSFLDSIKNALNGKTRQMDKQQDRHHKIEEAWQAIETAVNKMAEERGMYLVIDSSDAVRTSHISLNKAAIKEIFAKAGVRV